MSNQTMIRFGYPETSICEYEHWVVLLRESQVTLGSLVMCASSDVTEFSQLPSGAFGEMGAVIADIERVLYRAFHYDKINYLMLMMVDPNVHFHVFPRYASKRSACGLTMTDAGWPVAPRLDVSHEMTASERDAMRKHIKDFW